MSVINFIIDGNHFYLLIIQSKILLNHDKKSKQNTIKSVNPLIKGEKQLVLHGLQSVQIILFLFSKLPCK